MHYISRKVLQCYFCYKTLKKCNSNELLNFLVEKGPLIIRPINFSNSYDFITSKVFYSIFFFKEVDVNEQFIVVAFKN